MSRSLAAAPPPSLSLSLVLSLVLSLGALSVSCSSYRTVRGSGMVMVESRAVAPRFHSIQVSGAADVVLTQGAETSLSIECDDNLLPHILTTVEDSVLSVRFEPGSWSPSERPVYRIQLVEVRGIRLGGSNRLTAGSIESDDFSLRLSGSGTAQMDGVVATTAHLSTSGSGRILLGRLTAESADVRISGSGAMEVGQGRLDTLAAKSTGSGELLLPGLQISRASVRMSGSSEAELRVVEDLDVRISGSGTVALHGQPRAISTKVSGSGRVYSVDSE